MVYVSLFMWIFTSCDLGNDSVKNEFPILNVAAPETGFVYLDGRYTGKKTPSQLLVEPGNHVIGVALQSSKKYLRREIFVDKNGEVILSYEDQPQPRVWKALWVGIQEATGISTTGHCITHFSVDELDAGYAFFNWSIENHFEKYSYGTMKWEVERKDIVQPVELYRTSDTWFTLEPSTITALLPDVTPGNYDAIFVFWREKDGICSFQSSYFGLAWTDPLNEPIKTGYITVKFDAGSSINDRIEYYKRNDPGIWIHEWLHTVGENYFQQKGELLPSKGPDGLVVHAAEKYGYTYPWMSWYADFMAGRVKDGSSGLIYLGIGPEALLKCSLRETVNGDCHN
jgi:hypothetical protein